MARKRSHKRKRCDVTIDVDRSAIFVCPHVAKREASILRARRNLPDFPEDSGWEVLCNRDTEEDFDHLQIWAVHEVVDLEPSLAKFVAAPSGTEIVRKDQSSEWVVQKFDPFEDALYVPSDEWGIQNLEEASHSAVTLCLHVANEGHHVLRAERELPFSGDDSGWRLFCDSGAKENKNESRIWTIHKVLEREPSLAKFINAPWGTRIVRKDQLGDWVVQRFDPFDPRRS